MAVVVAVAVVVVVAVGVVVVVGVAVAVVVGVAVAVVVAVVVAAVAVGRYSMNAATLTAIAAYLACLARVIIRDMQGKR